MSLSFRLRSGSSCLPLPSDASFVPRVHRSSPYGFADVEGKAKASDNTIIGPFITKMKVTAPEPHTWDRSRWMCSYSQAFSCRDTYTPMRTNGEKLKIAYNLLLIYVVYYLASTNSERDDQRRLRKSVNDSRRMCGCEIKFENCLRV